MVDFAFTEVQQEFARVVRTFALAELSPKYAHWDRTGEFPTEQWRKMGQLGSPVSVSPTLTGDRRPIVSRGSPPRRSPAAILTAGTPSILNGEILDTPRGRLPGMAVVIISLPSLSQRHGAAQDAASMQTRAVRHGDEYILNGEKSGISMVMPADAVVVFAKTDMDAGARGVSAFLVPTDLPGLSRTPLHDMGERAIQRGSLFLDDVRVPRDALIGEEGQGFYLS